MYGGGEANVAVSLAQFGDNAEFFTKLPLNPIADACVNTLRGRGVGNALMQDMMYAASLSGVTAVTLEVRESNSAARALYEKFGFKCAGVRKNFYPDKENAVIYWLDI